MGRSASFLVPATTVPASAGRSNRLPAGSTCPSLAACLSLPADAEAWHPVGSSHSHAQPTWNGSVRVSVFHGEPFGQWEMGHWTAYRMIP